MAKRFHNKRKLLFREGFTLIELLVVIAILGVLMTITIVAVNPAKQIAQARNARRISDVRELINALQQYLTDHNGNLPAAITTTPGSISKNEIDLCAALAPVYVSGLPIDPSLGGGVVKSVDCGSSYDTGYEVSKDASANQITVSAPLAEYDQDISFTR